MRSAVGASGFCVAVLVASPVVSSSGCGHGSHATSAGTTGSGGGSGTAAGGGGTGTTTGGGGTGTTAGGGGTGTTSNGTGPFVPLQHFDMETFAVGSSPIVKGGTNGQYQLNTWWGKTGYGGIIATAQHRPGKTRSLQLSIQAGTSGNPGDGETPATNGLWGAQILPPASAPQKYGASGGNWHFGFWFYIPTGTSLATKTLSDGAQKFMLNGFPDYGVTGKDDVHICTDFQGFALINEFDPNEGPNNSYPSTRSPTNNPMNATIPQGKWTWVETMVHLDANGDDAIRRVWVSDLLVLERNGRNIKWQDAGGSYHTQTLGTVGTPTLPSASAELEFVFFFTYWNAHPSVDTTVFVDDFMTSIDESSMIYADGFGNPIMGSKSS